MEIRIDGNQVRSLREARLWTQEQLAEHCRVHPRTVQRVEAHGTGSSQTLRAIAAVLAVDPSALLLAAANGDAGDEGAHAHTVAVAGRCELPWIGVAAAFLWVALACLVHVATATPGAVASAVAALGFASFAIGLSCLDRRARRTA